MGAAPAHGVGRGTARAWLALSRVSNLPTVWTNVLAGMALSRPMALTPIDLLIFTWVAAAVSLLYIGGMFLNDAFDARFDAVHRPDRPIPAGALSRGVVFAAGFVLLGAGVLMIAMHEARAARWAAVLAGCITLYDWRHKGNSVAPLVMGACRALVYVAAASAVAAVTATVVVWAVVAGAYVVALTVVAKYGGDRWGWSIGWLIAGISIVDAIAIASTGQYPLAMIALAAFPVTMAAQRWVRGT